MLPLLSIEILYDMFRSSFKLKFSKKPDLTNSPLFTNSIGTTLRVPLFGKRRKNFLETQRRKTNEKELIRSEFGSHAAAEEHAWEVVSQKYNFSLKPTCHTWRTFLHELQTFKIRWRMLAATKQLMGFEIRDELEANQLLYLRADCSIHQSLAYLHKALTEHFEKDDQTMTSSVRFINEHHGEADMLMSSDKGMTQFFLRGKPDLICEMSLATFTYLHLEGLIIVLNEKTFGFPNHELADKEQMGALHEVWRKLRFLAKLRPVPLPIAEYRVAAK